MIKGRKRHIIADKMGLVIGEAVSAANTYDGNVAIELFGPYRKYFSRRKRVFADGSYKGKFETVIQQLCEADVEISSKPPSTRGFVPFKIR